MKPKQLTIFTPTYNRADVLPRLYESLCAQDCDDFLWLIVDDGSTDATSSLVRVWQEEGDIDICYVTQPNGGKMRAHNRGVTLCQTELFVCIDSDDCLSSPTVISEMLAFWATHVTEGNSPEVCGMLSYRKTEGLVGYFPQGGECLFTLREVQEHGCTAETTLVFKTAVIRQYPFPEIDGEKFITEAVVYDRLDMHYKYLLFPHYTQLCEYQPDGYTSHGWDYLMANPKGYRMYYNQLIELGRGSKVYNMKMYIACSLVAGDGNMFAACSSKMLLLLLLPLGFRQYRKLLNGKW